MTEQETSGESPNSTPRAHAPMIAPIEYKVTLEHTHPIDGELSLTISIRSEDRAMFDASLRKMRNRLVEISKTVTMRMTSEYDELQERAKKAGSKGGRKGSLKETLAPLRRALEEQEKELPLAREQGMTQRVHALESGIKKTKERIADLTREGANKSQAKYRAKKRIA